MTRGGSAPLRAAIYARMSTDKQSADSPGDQIARCRAFAAARGWKVLESLVIEDAGVSGASRHNRPKLLEVMARIAEWDVLLCWEFSRLARSSEDLGWIRNRLHVMKKTAFEAATGLDVFNVGSKVMGVLAEEYLVKLRADTHRGLRGRAERGLAAGGRPYGYRTEEIPSGRVDSHGRSIPAGYRIVIHDGEALVVRQIFELYAMGEGLRTIARQLNAEGAPSPRAKGWSSSALQAMLQNSIYRGEYVWNRSEWIKDHDTGRRRRYERPESEWVRQPVPELAIVSSALWDQARAAAAAKQRTYQRRDDGSFLESSARRGPSRYLLSGLLECGLCGGSFFAVAGGERYGCGWHRDRGPKVCGNALRIGRSELESRILGAVRERILVPEVVLYAVQRTLELVRHEVTGHDPSADRDRLREIESELGNLARFAAKTGNVEEAAGLYAELDRERAGIQARLSTPTPRLDLDALRPRVLERAEELRSAFAESPDHARAAFQALLRGRRMRVSPDAERKFRVEALFELALGPRAARGSGSGRLVSVVAGGRYVTRDSTKSLGLLGRPLRRRTARHNAAPELRWRWTAMLTTPTERSATRSRLLCGGSPRGPAPLPSRAGQ